MKLLTAIWLQFVFIAISHAAPSAQEIRSAIDLSFTAPNPQNIGGLDWLESQLSELESHPNTATDLAIRKLAAEFALKLFKVKYYQEGIWALRRGGHFTLADYAEDKMIAFMKRINLISAPQSNPRNNGVSSGKVVDLGFGFQGFLKPEDGGWAGSNIYEVEAYKLDKMLRLNRVPLAIPVKYNGLDYSLHLFVPNAGEGYNYRDSAYHVDATPETSEVYIFDVILRNHDRHMYNNLLSLTGRRFLIDNGRILFPERPGTAPPALELYMAQRPNLNLRVLTAVARLSIRDLHREFDGALTSQKVNELWTRINELLKYYPNVSFPMIEEDRSRRPKRVAEPIAVEPVVAEPIVFVADEFEQLLRQARRAENEVEKSAAAAEVLKVLNDPQLFEQALAQFGSERRLAHFFEDHGDALSRTAHKRFHRFLSEMQDKERAHERALQECAMRLGA